MLKIEARSPSYPILNKVRASVLKAGYAQLSEKLKAPTQVYVY